MNQRKYILELKFKARLIGAKLDLTPLESNAKLISVKFDKDIGKNGDITLHDATSYQRLVGKLMYATSRKTDISYVIQTLSQFMQQPNKSHLESTNGWLGT